MENITLNIQILKNKIQNSQKKSNCSLKVLRRQLTPAMLLIHTFR